MLKREIASHLLVTLVWLALITVLRWTWHWDLILLWLGGLVGTFLIEADHFFYLLLINPHELTSLRVKRLFGQRRIKNALVLIADTAEERTKLAFHNVLFQLILYILCFFVLTSTGNLFVRGLVMGMALHLLKDEFGELLAGREEILRRWLFWPVKVEVSFQNQKIFLALMALIFLGLNFLLV